MFKILTIALLGFVLFKLIFPNKRLHEKHSESIQKSQSDDTVDVDYEEVE